MGRCRHEAINLFGVEESMYVATSCHPIIVLKPSFFSSGLFPPRRFRLFARLSMFSRPAIQFGSDDTHPSMPLHCETIVAT